MRWSSFHCTEILTVSLVRNDRGFTWHSRVRAPAVFPTKNASRCESAYAMDLSPQRYLSTRNNLSGFSIQGETYMPIILRGTIFVQWQLGSENGFSRHGSIWNTVLWMYMYPYVMLAGLDLLSYWAEGFSLHISYTTDSTHIQRTILLRSKSTANMASYRISQQAQWKWDAGYKLMYWVG